MVAVSVKTKDEMTFTCYVNQLTGRVVVAGVVWAVHRSGRRAPLRQRLRVRVVAIMGLGTALSRVIVILVVRHRSLINGSVDAFVFA